MTNKTKQKMTDRMTCTNFVPMPHQLETAAFQPFSERLSLDQNKQLCKAAKLRHGGTKKDLIERLLDNEQTSQYGLEGNFFSLNVESIKQLCRARNLQVSGQKFDLVLRILHCDNGTTPEGTTLKRAATQIVSQVDAATGQVVEKHVPKKRKKAAPSASRAYSRVQKKIEAVTQKKYQVCTTIQL